VAVRSVAQAAGCVVKKNQVAIGNAYEAIVSGKRTSVRLLREAPKGWIAVNELTGREVTIRTAQRLRPLHVKPDLRQS
jgi:hypothetical protein